MNGDDFNAGSPLKVAVETGVVRRGEEEGVAGLGETEDEGFVGGGGAGGEDDVVRIESDVVAANLGHEINQ